MAFRSTRIWLTALFLIALAVRLGYAVLASDPKRNLPPHGYAREYVMAGARLLEYGTLTSPLILEDADHGPSAVMPPGYVALVAAVYALFGTETPTASFVLYGINALATALCVLCAFFMTRRIGGEFAAWLAAIVVTVNPTLIGFTNFIWDTNLFCLGVAVAALMSLRLADKPAGPGRWLCFGLYLGALALLNPAMTLAYPFLVLWPLTKVHGCRFGPLLRGIAVSVLGWALVITPWTVRNYIHFDQLIYIRGGFAIELWLGVCPDADAQGGEVYKRQFPLLNDDVQRRISSIGERAYITDCGDRAKAAIEADPTRFIRLVGERAVDYFLGTVYSHAAPGESGWPRSTSRAVICAFLAAEFLAVLVLLVLRRPPASDVWWLLAIVFSFSVVYCLTHIFVRFRAPTEPLVAVVIAVLASGWNRARFAAPGRGSDAATSFRPRATE